MCIRQVRGLVIALLVGLSSARAAEFETRVANVNWHADTDNTSGVGTWDVVSGAPGNFYPISGDTAIFKHRVNVSVGNPQVFSGGSLNTGLNPVWGLSDTLTLDGGTLTFNATGIIVIQAHGKSFVNHGTFLHACNQIMYWDAYTDNNADLLNNGTFRFTGGGTLQLRQHGTGPRRVVNSGTLSAFGGNGKISYGNTAHDLGVSNTVSGIIMADGATLDIEVQLQDVGGTLHSTNNGSLRLNSSVHTGGQTWTSTGTVFETGSGGNILLGGRAPQFRGSITEDSEVRLAMNVIIPEDTTAFTDFSGDPLIWGGKTTHQTITLNSGSVLEFRSPTVWDTTQYATLNGGTVRVAESNTLTRVSGADWYVRTGCTLENRGTLTFSGSSTTPVRMDSSTATTETFLNTATGTIVVESGTRTFSMGNTSHIFSNLGTLEVRNGSTLTVSASGLCSQWNGAGTLTGGTWKLLAGAANATLNLDPANAGITTIGADAAVILSKTGAGNPSFAELSGLDTVNGRLGLHANMQYTRTALAVPGTLEFGLTDENLGEALLVVNGDPDFTGGTVDVADLGLISGTYTLATWTGTASGSLTLGTTPVNGMDYALEQDDVGKTCKLIVTPGSTVTIVTWTGNQDANWGNANNWDNLALPFFQDIAVIPATARDPILDINRTIGGLTNQVGANLYLNGRNLTINGNARNLGTIVADAGETLFLRGDADFTGGSFTAAASTVMIDGASAQTLALGGNTFHDLTVFNTSATVTVSGTLAARNVTVDGVSDTLTFGGAITAVAITISNTASTVAFESSVTAGELRCLAVGPTLRFQAGQTVALTNLHLRGEAGSPIALRSSSAGVPWNLNVSGWHAVRYVDAQDSNADGGRKIYAINATDGTGNSNWDFGVWHVWSGSLSSDFGTAGNWTNGTAPGAGSAVLIDGDYTHAPIISSEISIGKLAVGIGELSVLTVNTNLVTNGDILVMTFGTITHAGPSATPSGKVSLTVGGDLVVDAGGRIDVTGKGYTARNGPGYGGAVDGAGHGGMGGDRIGHGTDGGLTYGRIKTPTDYGSGGDAASGAAGGGVILMAVGGASVLNGIVAANGSSNVGPYSGGSGGSVFLSTGSLTGNGAVTVNGGDSTDADWGAGGGGRIAVVLTNGTDFGAIAFQAYCGSFGLKGGAGTVYLKRSSESYGRLIVDNNDYETVQATMQTTLCNESNRFDAVFIGGKAKLELGANALVNLTGGTLTGDGNLRSRLIVDEGSFIPPASFTLTNTVISLKGTSNRTWTTDMTIGSGGVLTHEDNSTGESNKLVLTIQGNLSIGTGGAINVDGLGYDATQGPGRGTGIADGGGYGGEGGDYNNDGGVGTTYGAITAPTALGSGGSGGSGGAGGGAAVLTVTGTSTINGSLSADGGTPSGSYAGGSGGSVFVSTGAMTGSGTITANGGNSPASQTGWAAGGGGRIAIILTGGTDIGSVACQASSGTNGLKGAAGTVYVQTAEQGAGRGTVNIDNNGWVTAVRTHLPPATNAVSDELKNASIVVANRGALALTANAMVQALTVASINEPLDLGADGTVLEVRALTVNGTAYDKAGLYTASDWNGFTPIPSNVTGAGAIMIGNSGTIFMMR